MATYVLGDFAIRDPDGFKEYAQKVRPLLESYGARYLVRGGDVEILEGEWEHHTVVLLEFPSREVADEFYRSDEYAPLLALRLESADSTVSVLEGYLSEGPS